VIPDPLTLARSGLAASDYAPGAESRSCDQ